VHPPASLALARRLEGAEAAANAAFVDARRQLQPDLGATWIAVAGAYAMFDGPASPLTQTFGLGLFEPFLAPQFETVEAFFRSRGAATCHEVCSFAASETSNLLETRGYAPIEDSTVLIRSTTTAAPPDAGDLTVHRIDAAEGTQWARTAAHGWASESTELAAFIEGLGMAIAQARGSHCFLATIAGEPVAAGAVHLSADVALLAGASTIPSARRRGAQQALLQARLAFAAAQGIDLAMVVTQPASASQRNAERQGFRPVYGRRKWQRALD
jgi:GNAT superfamily N-acetyltransferase